MDIKYEYTLRKKEGSIEVYVFKNDNGLHMDVLSEWEALSSSVIKEVVGGIFVFELSDLAFEQLPEHILSEKLERRAIAVIPVDELCSIRLGRSRMILLAAPPVAPDCQTDCATVEVYGHEREYRHLSGASEFRDIFEYYLAEVRRRYSGLLLGMNLGIEHYDEHLLPLHASELLFYLQRFNQYDQVREHVIKRIKLDLKLMEAVQQLSAEVKAALIKQVNQLSPEPEHLLEENLSSVIEVLQAEELESLLIFLRELGYDFNKHLFS